MMGRATGRSAALLVLAATLAAPAMGCLDRPLPEGIFACDPNEPNTCPEGWVCQRRGTGADYYCYATSEASCGDAVWDPGEECDGNDFGGGGCGDFQQPEGWKICLPDCRLYCTSCGNGLVELRADGTREECDDGNDVSGDGCDECRLPHCGNGTLEVYELCDDGNRVDGDGCASNCLSDERCGNRVVDVTLGEQCDDGNALSRDGCSSGCQLEELRWTELAPRLPPVQQHSMVFDTARSRALLMGGDLGGGSLLNEMYEFDGTRWFASPVPFSPPARFRALVAYDSHRQRTVLYGGSRYEAGIVDNADTWELDSTHWSLLMPATSPPAASTSNACMTFDATRHQTVLVAGGVTWAFDGTNWANVGAAPLTGTSPLCVYDDAREAVVLVADWHTWEFDGQGWVDVTPAMFPNDPQALFYDADLDQVTAVALDGIWRRSGTTWSQVTSDLPSQERYSFAVAYDPLAARALYVGGSGSGISYSDTWSLDSAHAWQELIPTETALSPTHGTALVSIATPSATGMLLTHLEGPLLSQGTWLLNQDVWRKLSPAGALSERSNHALVAIDGGALLFGGTATENPWADLNDTWLFDGAAWQKLDLPYAPPPRGGAAMAYDTTRGEVLLFGGDNGLGDTWRFDGTRWERLHTQTLPGEDPDLHTLFTPALAHDPLRDRYVLLLGGCCEPNTFDPILTTWEFDGVDWSLIQTSETPPTANGFGLTHDSRRGRLVLTAGFANLDQTEQSAQTWEYDIDGWHAVAPANAEPWDRPGFTYDAANRQCVSFGGRDQTLTDTARTRFLGFVSSTPDEECRNGADDDGDTLVDCQDPDCNGTQACQAVERCDNGLDDDGDTLVDCLDPNCQAYAFCGAETGERRCRDGIDNDNDGRTDCADPACNASSHCGTENDTLTCQDRIDNDADGDLDCADPDCASLPICTSERSTLACSDHRDNDGNGDIDCDDWQCAGYADCLPENSEGRCSDGKDNDRNALVDCADPGCSGTAVCGGEGQGAACFDGVDNDADGDLDCADEDCGSSCSNVYETFDVDGHPLDLQGQRIVFTPDSGDGYTWQIEPSTGFGIAPGSGPVSTYYDEFSPMPDRYEAVTLGFVFPYFDEKFALVYVAPQGHLAFDRRTVRSSGWPHGQNPTTPNLLYEPTIAVLTADLNPSRGDGGQVIIDRFSDHLAVTYQFVGTTSSDYFNAQVVLRSSGVVEMYFGALSVTQGGVGLLAGRGEPLTETVDLQ